MEAAFSSSCAIGGLCFNLKCLYIDALAVPINAEMFLLYKSFSLLLL